MNAAPLYAWLRRHPSASVFLFIGLFCFLGIVAFISAFRNGVGWVDIVIKIIAGWAALVFVFFGTPTAFILAWSNSPRAKQKKIKVLYFVLGILTAAALFWYVTQWMF